MKNPSRSFGWSRSSSTAAAQTPEAPESKKSKKSNRANQIYANARLITVYLVTGNVKRLLLWAPGSSPDLTKLFAAFHPASVCEYNRPLWSTSVSDEPFNSLNVALTGRLGFHHLTVPYHKLFSV